MSAQFDASQLVQPITAERPCGDNLEDTALLASFDAFHVFGHSTPLDPAPDWDEVKDRSLEALARSKDLRFLAHLAAALLRTDGLPAFARTLTVAAGWLKTHWDETYPPVDEDAICRRNALNCLADPMAVIDGLRRVPLADSRQHGRFSLRDIEIAAGGSSDRSGAPRDEQQIAAAFASMPLPDIQVLEQSAAAAVTAVNAIDATMREKRGSDAAPAFETLLAQLVRIQRVVGTHSAARIGNDGAAAATDGSAAPIAADMGRPAAAGPVRSREDATRALDAVAAFFRQHEPSSPIPMFLERAQRLVSRDFLEVLADIAPDALAQARAAGGVKQR
jgi:type VI secretion system protein ImpA